MTYNTIIYAETGHVAEIRLNRPDRMNAVIEEMYTDLLDAFNRAGSDTNIRAVILTGSSFTKNNKTKQAFCAGADLKKHASGDRSLADKKAYIELAHRTCLALYQIPKPTIAVINGPARGAGSEMAMNCDFIFMEKQTTMAFPESSLGTCAGGGVTAHLIHTAGITTAKDLLFSGTVITGTEAEDLGIVFKACPIETLMDQAVTYAEKLCSRAPVSITLLKKLLNRPPGTPLQTVLDNETDSILTCMETRDWHEGLHAFSEKRPPAFKGE